MMSAALEITQETMEDEVLIVAVQRRTRPLHRARPALAAARRDRRPGSAVVLDLRETTFLDSTALGVIIAAMKALRRRGGRLVLVNDRRSITKILAITGLDQLLTVEASLEDALARARQPLISGLRRARRSAAAPA